MKRALAAWVIVAGLAGCDDPEPASDAAEGGVDASMNVACDPGAHVDCFFAVECSGGVVRWAPGQPYYCCDERRCSAAYQNGICWTRHETCSAGCGDMRRFGCDREAQMRRYQPSAGGGDLRDFCAEGGRTTGDRCAVDRDCTPSRPGLPGRLRCDRDAGACVTAPRPSVAIGAECLVDDDCADAMLCACESTTAGRCAARP
ncbi:MAG: hypothetical protein JWM10_470 [Myxococcaceae bacterium]|nr:hypothetical protein [Myxococcaceae bacterium]